MATYDCFTPVNIRVNYNMNSAESTDAFKNLQTKILDKFSSPGVEIARDSVDIERIYRKFFVKVCVCVVTRGFFFPLTLGPFEVYINGGLVFSKYRFGHYPSAGDINSVSIAHYCACTD